MWTDFVNVQNSFSGLRIHFLLFHTCHCRLIIFILLFHYELHHLCEYAIYPVEYILLYLYIHAQIIIPLFRLEI